MDQVALALEIAKDPPYSKMIPFHAKGTLEIVGPDATLRWEAIVQDFGGDTLETGSLTFPAKLLP